MYIYTPMYLRSIYIEHKSINARRDICKSIRHTANMKFTIHY